MRALALMLALVMTSPAFAEAPKVQVVFMTADWCPNCAALAPQLATAITRVEGVARVDVDTTDARRRAASAERARAHDVTPIYDAYAGRTGFAAVVDRASGRTLGCITGAYAAPEIEGALRRAVWNAAHPQRPPRELRLSACPA